MLTIAFAIFLILHGLVHLLYAGQSERKYELQSGLAWPDGAWAFSGWMAGGSVRRLASACLALATVGFVAGGIGLLLDLGWWMPVVLASAIFSSLVYILFWDGTRRDLDDKGAIGLLINIGIVVAVLLI